MRSLTGPRMRRVRVEHGVVQSHADVVATLEDAGFERRTKGRDYVTARDPESGKRWRLKGALFGFTEAFSRTR